MVLIPEWWCTDDKTFDPPGMGEWWLAFWWRNKLRWWKADIPEFWHEWSKIKAWVQVAELVEDRRVHIWNTLNLPEWIIHAWSLKNVLSLIDTLETWWNDARLRALNNIYSILWMRGYNKVLDDRKIGIFMEHYPEVKKAILDYENDFTFLATNTQSTTERLLESLWEIKSKLSIFYSLN